MFMGVTPNTECKFFWQTKCMDDRRLVIKKKDQFRSKADGSVKKKEYSSVPIFYYSISEPLSRMHEYVTYLLRQIQM